MGDVIGCVRAYRPIRPISLNAGWVQEVLHGLWGSGFRVWETLRSSAGLRMAGARSIASVSAIVVLLK